MTNQLSNERYQEAMELHAQIMASGNTAARALVEFARLLKRMKDEKLYEVFDQSFDEYVEKQVGIKKRQAYTYIAALERLGAPMMEQNANLGITKLELLSQVSPIERVDVLENYDLGEMSAAEVKKLVEDLTNKGEQLNLFKQENEQLKAELEKAKQTAAEEAAERAKIEYERADRNNEELRAEIESLKKKMSIAGNQDAAIVSAYCKTVLSKVLNELVQMIGDAKGRDTEQGAKLAKAAAGMLGSAQAQIAAMAEV